MCEHLLLVLAHCDWSASCAILVLRLVGLSCGASCYTRVLIHLKRSLYAIKRALYALKRVVHSLERETHVSAFGSHELVRCLRMSRCRPHICVVPIQLPVALETCLSVPLVRLVVDLF